LQQIAEILIWLPAILIGLTFHEYAHGRVAYILGDDTAYLQGRLTLNPLPHIDWMGFFMLIIAHFGWAKPVQVNPVNFNRNITMKQGMMLVSLAGPAMNLLLALVGMIALRILVPLQDNVWAGYVLALLIPLIQINLILAAFNLIPVPPWTDQKFWWFVAGRWDTIDVVPGTIRTNPTFAAYYHRGDRKDIIAAGNHTVQPVI
jgi:Zn-dependent protease